MCTPTPATEASKLDPVTPGPDQVPPVGDSPLKVRLVLTTQSSSSANAKVTTGTAKTSISCEAVSEQPFISQKVYVIVCTPGPALAAIN